MKHLIAVVSVAIVVWTAPALARDMGSEVVPAEQNPVARGMARGGPAETTGIETSAVLGVIPLENFFAALKGRNLRAREVVLLPGARIATHAHDRRPAMGFVLEGELVEHRSDREQPVIRRRGDAYFETFGVVHWLENVSPNRVRVLAVDIAPGNPE